MVAEKAERKEEQSWQSKSATRRIKEKEVSKNKKNKK